MSEEATLDEFTKQEERSLEKAKGDWAVEQVKDHTKLVSGAHVKSDKVHKNSSSEPYLTGPDDFEGLGFRVTKYTDDPTKFCESGDTLVTVKGSGCGKAAFANQRACISRQLKALRPEPSVNPLYLYYSVKSKENFLQTLSEGSAIPGLSNSHLNTLDIPVPPLHEQHKIATVLYTVDRAIEKSEEIVQSLNKLQKGTLRQLFENGTDRDTTTKETPMGKFPKHWELKQLQEACTLINGSAFPKDQQEKTEGKFPFIKVSDTNDYRRYVTGAKNYISQEQADEIGCNLHPKGTVILPKRGAAIMTNKRRILAQESAIDNNQIGIVGEEVQPLFLYYYLSDVDMGRFVQEGAVKSLTKSLLSKIRVPVPPTDTQTQIIEVLESIDSRIEIEQEIQTEYQRLKKSLQQDLLSGTVRTTDTNIEVPDEIAQHG